MADDLLAELAEKAGLETGMPKRSKAAEVDEPTYDIDSAGRYVLTWKPNGIRIIAEAAERQKRELWVLLTVQWRDDDLKPRTLIAKKRLNLRSMSGTAETVRYLKSQLAWEWAARIEMLAQYVDANFHAGEPMVWLDEVPDPGPTSYLADPLLEAGEHNVLFADGGSTKSFLALALCISYAQGKSIIPGVKVNGQGKALYLDWETSKDNQRRRFKQFVGTATSKGVAYKAMVSPLIDAADDLRPLISEHKFGLVVCDSASMASGGQIMDETAVAQFFLACRSFKTTVQTLAHIPKHGEHDRPIGSTYWYNQARVVWELVKDQTEGDDLARLDLIQHKSNNDQTHKPFGLELDFSTRPVTYRGAEAGHANAEHLPVPTMLHRLLLDEGKMTVADIAVKLDKTPQRILNILQNQEGRMFASNGAKRDRLWWALAEPVNGFTKRLVQPHVEPPLRGSTTRGVYKDDGEEKNDDRPWSER
jgi:hypothetical protein